MEIKEIWEAIVEYGIATDEELGLVTNIWLVTNICGYNVDTLNAVIYARTGYRDIEQFLEYYLESEA